MGAGEAALQRVEGKKIKLVIIISADPVSTLGPQRRHSVLLLCNSQPRHCDPSDGPC